jgi:hypothetical protein
VKTRIKFETKYRIELIKELRVKCGIKELKYEDLS